MKVTGKSFVKPSEISGESRISFSASVLGETGESGEDPGEWTLETKGEDSGEWEF